MRCAVIVFPGSNCDQDCLRALRQWPEMEVAEVWHNEQDLSRYDLIVVPGGFSYGDYLRCGAIASTLPIIPALRQAVAEGKFILGICNGFQILLEMELLPGSLLRNESLQFLCHDQLLEVSNNETPFTTLYQAGERISLPIAHGDGNYYCDAATLQVLQQHNQIVLRYADNNPNGSVDNIAGICNRQHNVVGMMPHPERAVSQWLGSEDGQRLFKSVLAAWQTQSQAQELDAAQIRQQQLYRQLGMTDNEYQQLCTSLARDPNYTELGIVSVMWSEHCAYKHSKTLLKQFPTKGERVLLGPGEGAGVVDIGDGEAVVFKIESHNHHSAIEPYQGAATGVGGIIRDIISMGARPLALLNSLRFGELDNNPQVKHLFSEVVAGIAGYGNCIGIPTVGEEVMFDRSYQGNPLVNAMCVGVIEQQRIQLGVAKGVGNPVLYMGPATGRDGIHGATFASTELSAEAEAQRSAVQVGDPFMGKLVMEATLELINSGIVVGIQDMGAAGLTCSSAEMAAKAGKGLWLDLDAVPQRERNMSAYELMLSESQERMLVVLEPRHMAQAEEIVSRWGIPFAWVGEVRDDGLLQISQHGQEVAVLPVSLLVDEAPVYQPQGKAPESYLQQRQRDGNDFPVPEDIAQLCLDLLGSANIGSRRWIYQQYDYMVRCNTALAPGSDAAVILIEGSDKALSLCTDCNSRYVALDPQVGGMIAVAEAARNVVCSGAQPLAITDNLNFGNPQDPAVYWQMEQSCRGIAEACRILKTSVIGGNVSLYNESVKGAIYPTPVIGMVGLITSRQHITAMAPQAGEWLLLLGETMAELGGSELQQHLTGSIFGQPPKLNLQREKRLQQTLLTAIRSGWINSAHDLAQGGLLIALCKMCIAACRGASLQLEGGLPASTLLFSKTQSRVIVSASESQLGRLQQHLQSADQPYSLLGRVEGERLTLNYNQHSLLSLSVAEISERYLGALTCLMNS